MATDNLNNGNMSIQNPPSGSEDQISNDTESSDAPMASSSEASADASNQGNLLKGVDNKIVGIRAC